MNIQLANRDTVLSSATPMVGGLHLAVLQDIDLLEDAWKELEASGHSTAYQTFAWCNAWVNRVGAHRSISPVVVVAHDVFGAPVFILPLQLRQKLGVRIIEALTAPQGAYAFGLFADSFMAQAPGWFADHFDRIAAMLPSHDVLRLADLPTTVAGVPNPLLIGHCFLAANQSHIMDLQPDYKALLAQKRSAASRRSIRKRDVKLEQSGQLSFELPETDKEREATLHTMLSHHEARMGEAGILNVYDKVEQNFIMDLRHAETSDGHLLRPYRLVLDGQVLAVMLGLFHRNTCWALISSLAPGENRKHSPGDHALRAMIKHLCESGAHTLDFSAGDTAYKSHWSNRRIQLHVHLRANSLKGFATALFMLGREKAKRIAKNTPVLNSALFSLRRMMFGQKQA